MATIYPKMPLNVQISQNYSKFLDMNLLNFRHNNGQDTYPITTSLSWKKQNTYNYISEKDNKCPTYKGAVVPITMTRINRRCTRYDEIRHHNSFILKILMSRGQCPIRIAKRRADFLTRIKNGKNSVYQNNSVIFASTYDGVSKSHETTSNIIRKSAKFKTSFIYKSLASSSARLCPKRKVLEKIKYIFRICHSIHASAC